MASLTFSEAVSLGSLAVAAIALVTNFFKGARGNAARDQLVYDKLDRAVEMSRETLGAVKELSSKLDDHSLTLTRHTEQILALDRRLEKLENDRDQHHLGVGSTD